MTNYATDLKQWGDQGTLYPTGYSYAQGEPPVDEWDDFFNYHVWKDLNHLIGVTNKRLDSSHAQRPSSPEDGHLYWGGDGLEVYDASENQWEDIVLLSEANYLPLTGGEMRGEIDLGGYNLSDENTTIWNTTGGYVPQSSLEADSFTVNTDDNISASSSVKLGGNLDISIDGGININTDKYITGGGEIGVGGTGSIGFDISKLRGNFDDRYVNKSGDTMSGDLKMENNNTTYGTFGNSKLTIEHEYGKYQNGLGTGLYHTEEGNGYPEHRFESTNREENTTKTPLVLDPDNNKSYFNTPVNVRSNLSERGNRVATQPWTENTQLSSQHEDIAYGQLKFKDGARVYNNGDGYDDGLIMWWDHNKGNGGPTSRLTFRQGDGYPSLGIYEENGTITGINGSNYNYFHWDLKVEESTLNLHDNLTVDGINKTTGELQVENKNPRLKLNDTSIQNNVGSWAIDYNAGDVTMRFANGFKMVMDGGNKRIIASDGNGNSQEIANLG